MSVPAECECECVRAPDVRVLARLGGLFGSAGALDGDRRSAHTEWRSSFCTGDDARHIRPHRPSPRLATRARCPLCAAERRRDEAGPRDAYAALAMGAQHGPCVAEAAVSSIRIPNIDRLWERCRTGGGARLAALRACQGGLEDGRSTEGARGCPGVSGCAGGVRSARCRVCEREPLRIGVVGDSGTTCTDNACMDCVFPRFHLLSRAWAALSWAERVSPARSANTWRSGGRDPRARASAIADRAGAAATTASCSSDPAHVYGHFAANVRSAADTGRARAGRSPRRELGISENARITRRRPPTENPCGRTYASSRRVRMFDYRTGRPRWGACFAHGSVHLAGAK